MAFFVEPRVRVPTQVLPGEQFSFPSGHSMRAAFVAGTVLRSGAFGAAFGAPSSAARAAALVWAALVAASRVAKGKHFPIDVLAGNVLGLALALVPP